MKIPLALSCFIPLTIAICDYGTTFYPRDVDAVSVADFGYNELEGPLNWHGLKAENDQCAIGKNQSPININSAEIESIPGSDISLDIQSYPDGAEFENLGSTVEVIANGTLLRDDKEYELKQFHFHTSSEHRLDSEVYPMEVHFVFQSDDQSLSVIGLMIEVGSSDEALPLFEDVFNHIDDIKDPGTTTETGPLSFDDLQQHIANTALYAYSGSLTTPPCTEGVAWLVGKEPVYIDIGTFIKVKDVLKFNSRYTQNKLGETNLLDNARVVLDKSG